jgi:hypothetical protein
MTKTIDPIFAAIEAHKASEKKWQAIATLLDRKEFSAKKKIGPDPHRSVLWRNYGVDEDDIKEKRDLYLEQRVASPRVIKAEYLDVLERCREQSRKADRWARRAGVLKLREQVKRGVDEDYALATRLSRVKPTTLAGAAALIEYIASDFEHSCPIDWQIRALATATSALRTMERRRTADRQAARPE